MKRVKSTVFKTAVIMLAILSLIIAANAGYITTQQERKDSESSGDRTQPLFFAEISIGVYGEGGCQGCAIPYAAVEAYGSDTDHFDTNITDINGLCILELEYEATYRLTIETEGYYLVMVDFKVIDDQPFSFHLQEEEESTTPNMFLLNNIFQRIRQLKHL